VSDDSAAGPSNVFCGTSAFAAVVLRSLAATAHRPALVVTPPDRRRGRGRRLAAPPVAEAAGELGLELHQTEDVNLDASRTAIAAHRPAVGLVCAFGQLIKEPLISELPMLNVHPSLLPRWRGAAPIERAIMAGDERTGVCVMRLTEGLDSGPVALCEELAIAPGEDYGALAARLAERGGFLLAEALDRYAGGTLELSEQSEKGVTYAEKIKAGERRVDPRATAAGESLRIRALSPHIDAFVELPGGDRLGVRSAEPVEAELAPGRFGEAEGRLVLGCAEGALAIGELQPAGGRWMAASDYLRGRGAPEAAASA